jgi:hypothetical protein
MPVNNFYNYNDAYLMGVKFIPEISVPREPNINDPYDVSVEALKNTLGYIFNYLHHQCYMLCVKDNVNTIYKLQSNTTAPIYKNVLKKAVKNLDRNPTLSPFQRKYIARTVDASKQIRIMQCIVKQLVQKNVPTEDTTNEYTTLLEGVNLPNGVFILNLTDAVILRADKTHPFPSVVGENVSIGRYGEKKHIPIFSISGQRGYLDIQIPNYDDVMTVIGSKTDTSPSEFITSWKDKTINRAVFRGGSTGCGYTANTNARIKISTMMSPLLDAGITMNGKTIDTMSIKFDPKYGIGMMNTKIKPVPFMTMKDQSEHKYIIHIDGNVNAYRLITTLSTGSLMLRVMSEYTSWFDALIDAGKHYIAIKPDLSDLLSKIEWCNSHESECRIIAERGRRASEWAFSKENIVFIMQLAIWRATVPSYSPIVTIKVRKTRKNTSNIKTLEGFPIVPKNSMTIGGRYKTRKKYDVLPNRRVVKLYN